MKHEAGYTMIELLVVLTIMSLLITAVPEMTLRAVDAIRFSGKIEQVGTRLSAAHEKAVETGQTIVLSPSAFASVGIAFLTPARLPEIDFYPDGSASATTVTVECLGRRRNLSIDTITGLVEGL